jgi:hypothetical protein
MWNVVPDSKCHVDEGSPYRFRWRSHEIEPFRELEGEEGEKRGDFCPKATMTHSGKGQVSNTLLWLIHLSFPHFFDVLIK